MSLVYNGVNTDTVIFNGQPTIGVYNGAVVWGDETGPSLPPYTIRLKYRQGFTPTFAKGTGVLVDSSENIWDLTYEMSDWSGLLYNDYDLLEVISSNTNNVTSMYGMFLFCGYLTTVSQLDTSNVTNMQEMFEHCSNLLYVPLLDTSNVTNMDYMFYNCERVQSGALALYQQASTQTTPPTSHSRAFYNCGIYTTTGAAELAQIPSDWK